MSTECQQTPRPGDGDGHHAWVGGRPLILSHATMAAHNPSDVPNGAKHEIPPRRVDRMPGRPPDLALRRSSPTYDELPGARLPSAAPHPFPSLTRCRDSRSSQSRGGHSQRGVASPFQRTAVRLATHTRVPPPGRSVRAGQPPRSPRHGLRDDRHRRRLAAHLAAGPGRPAAGERIEVGARARGRSSLQPPTPPH